LILPASLVIVAELALYYLNARWRTRVWNWGAYH